LRARNVWEKYSIILQMRVSKRDAFPVRVTEKIGSSGKAA